MPADPHDDFSVFDGSEHMFFGLDDPYGVIRQETEAALRRQVPDTVVESIVTYDKPKFLTSGRKVDDGKHIVVTQAGCCFRARVTATGNAGALREVLPSAVTFLSKNLDQPGKQQLRMYFDLHQDAERGFTDEVFKQRFIAFRVDES